MENGLIAELSTRLVYGIYSITGKTEQALLMKKNIFIFVSMINYRRVIIFSRKYTGSVLKLTRYLTK